MNMGTPTVLPLKPQPVVSGSKDSNVVGFDKLHYSRIEEPVCDSLVLDDCLGTSSPGVRVVRADESCQLRPLEVCCTVSEEDGRQTQCVDHGEQTTPLTLPVLPAATQTGSIVEHSTGECLPTPPHHVPKFV